MRNPSGADDYHAGDYHCGKVWCSPVLPERIGRLCVDRIPLAGRRVTVEIEDGAVRVDGLPPEVELVQEPRHPLTA